MDRQTEKILKEKIKVAIPRQLKSIITKGSVPIPYCGNYDKAKVCTIGINPSDIEFTTNWCPDIHPVSRKALHKDDNKELSDNDCKKVIDYCNNYFNYPPNCQDKWFRGLSLFCQTFTGKKNYSYKDGTMVHLDMVKWATQKPWGTLESDDRKMLIEGDRDILATLLKKDFKYIFINGTGAFNIIHPLLKGKDLKECQVPYKDKKVTIHIEKYNKSTIVAWSFSLGRMPGRSMVNINDCEQVIEFAKAVLKGYNSITEK